jgi:hypothetical protein
MSNKNIATDDWKPCPPGALSVFAGRERTRQRRIFLTKAAGASAIFLLAVSVGYLAFGPSRFGEQTFGGVTCTTVRSYAPQYMAGQLDAQFSEQIRIHLEQCPACQRFWKEMAGRKAMGQVSLPTPLRTSESCGCEACRHRDLLAMPQSGKSLAKPLAVDQRLALSR